MSYMTTAVDYREPPEPRDFAVPKAGVTADCAGPDECPDVEGYCAECSEPVCGEHPEQGPDVCGDPVRACGGLMHYSCHEGACCAPVECYTDI